MSELMQHHVKYEEIHGVDEIVMLTRSEHAKLHLKLRKEGKCDVPANKLCEISDKAHRRSPKGKATSARYARTKKGKAQMDEYRQSEAGKLAAIRGASNLHPQRLEFSESFGRYTTFNEQIRYNEKSGAVYYVAYFQATCNHTLPVINIGE